MKIVSGIRSEDNNPIVCSLTGKVLKKRYSPEIKNLVMINRACSGTTLQELESEFPFLRLYELD